MLFSLRLEITGMIELCSELHSGQELRDFECFGFRNGKVKDFCEIRFGGKVLSVDTSFGERKQILAELSVVVKGPLSSSSKTDSEAIDV